MKLSLKLASACLCSLIVAAFLALAPAAALADNTGSGLNGGFSVENNDKAGTIEITRPDLRGTEPKGIEPGSWTILVYMCGSNLESESAAASADIREMIEAYSGSAVRYVIATGGSREWHFDGANIDPGKIQVYEVQGGGLKLLGNLKHSGSTPNMGDPENLARFVSWGIEEYPADNIGLIFWDHGGGPLGGVCQDELAGDILELGEIDAALNAVSQEMWEKLEFVGFDACLMSSFEVANYLASYANYMIGSEESEPGGGWDYMGTSAFLTENKNATGADLGEKLVEDYYDSYDETFYQQARTTLSVVDLSCMDELNQAINAFSQDLIQMCDDENAFASYAKQLDMAYLCGGYTYSLLDLKEMVLTYKETYANDNSKERLGRVKELLDAIDDSVIESKGGVSISEACGLSIYYPVLTGDNASSVSSAMTQYDSVCPTPRYLDFTKRRMGLATSSDTQQIIKFAKEPQIDADGSSYGKGVFFFTLSDGVDEFVSNVRGFVRCEYEVTDAKTGETGLRTLALGNTYDVKTDGKGTYTDGFNGKWLTLPDEQCLALYADSVIIGGKHADLWQKYLSPVMVKRGNSDAIKVALTIYQNTASKEVRFGGYLTSEEENLGDTFGRDSDDEIQVQVGDIIAPAYRGFEGSDEGQAGWYRGRDCTVDNNFSIGYGPMREGRTYYYRFDIADVYGNVYKTDWAEFSINADGALKYKPDLVSIK